MAGGPSPHPHLSREPKRPTHWPTRRMSALCLKPGSRWSDSWMVARPVRVGQGLCSTWRGHPIPGYRTSCPSTWTSGGHSSSWLGSPAVRSGCLGTNTSTADSWPEKAMIPSTLWSARSCPHLKCHIWTFVPVVPWPSCPKLAGARGRTCLTSVLLTAQGPAPGAGREELQANKVEKLPFWSGLDLGVWGPHVASVPSLGLQTS